MKRPAYVSTHSRSLTAVFLLHRKTFLAWRVASITRVPVGALLLSTVGLESASGLVGAAVLLHCGFTVRDALSAISKARGVQVPDTTEQSEWLSRYQGAIARCHLETV